MGVERTLSLQTNIGRHTVSISERVETRTTPQTVPTKRTLAGASDDPVRDYLQKIGSIPILTAEEETELAICIEAGVLAQEKLDSGGRPVEHARPRAENTCPRRAGCLPQVRAVEPQAGRHRREALR